MPQKYDPWLVNKLKELLDTLLLDQEESIRKIMGELFEGIQYGKQTPGSMDGTLILVAEHVLSVLKDIYSKKESKKEQFNVNELKNVLSERKKEKVIKKMSGSLDMLKNFEDE